MNTNIKTREYTTVSEVSGPLMVVEGVEGVGYNEIVDIETPTGEKRSGQVLEVTKDVAVIQVFEGTNDLNTKDTKTRFTGQTAKIGVSRDMMGRIFNGIGKPIDGGPEIIPDEELDINLNSPECQNSLKKLFTLILEKVVDGSVEITLEIRDGYSRGMYIEVCEEYIKDLNRELGEVTELIKKEIIE